MPSNPLITIITSSFNDRDALLVTIDEVSRLKGVMVEHVIVDGGSTDGTIEVLKNSAHSVTRWISEKDSGIYDAWNKGLELANGKYIAFLGAGDKYVDGGLLSLVECAISNPDADFISGKVIIESLDKSPRIIGSAWCWDTFKRHMNTNHVGALHSRRLFDRYGKFDSSYRIAGDYEMLLRPKSDLQTAFVNRVTAVMLGGGISQINFNVLKEVRRAKMQHKTTSLFIATLDYWIATIKLFTRKYLL